MQGMIHVYTGNGKGKTTAALGLGLRAVGRGKKVCVIQFMKGRTDYGELESARHLLGFEIRQFGRPDFVDRNRPEPEDFQGAREAMDFAAECMAANEWDILVLDELNVALDFKLVAVADVLDLLKGKPERLEVIITGRYAPPEIVDCADLVTEMREVKHYYARGVQARPGIEC